MYKYSLNVHGTNATIRRFALALNTIGHEAKETVNVYTTALAIGVPTQGHSYLGKGQYGTFNDPTRVMPREFIFDIDNQWEYEAALAIAAIKDDDLPHIGEWVAAGRGCCGEHTIIGEIGSLHKVSKIGSIPQNFTVEGYDCSHADVTSLDYDRKATPEEIIQHFKKEYKQNNMNNRIIGYKAPTDLFGGNIKAGTIFKSVTDNSYKTGATGKTQYSRHLPKEIVETWEPVYEEEGFKKGDWITIVSCAFKLSDAYSIGGTYKLQENFSPISGNFLAGPDNRGSDTNGYTSRTANYFTDKEFKITVRKATEEEIEKATDIVEINGYKPTVEDGKIAFGCQKFTKQDLASIAKLFNKGIRGVSIKIGDVEITGGIITKLIAKLKI